jgi:hypothetical protein
MSKATTAVVSLLIAALVCAFSLSAAALPVATTMTLAIAPGSSVDAGTAVTLTATVTGATAGTVLFCDATATYCDGAAVFGAAQVTSDGTAEFKFTPGAGSYSIQAEFLGFTGVSPSVGASASVAQSLTVTGLSNYASLTSIEESGSVGNYTLTGLVTAFGKTTATGTVSFLDTSDGNAVLGTAALNAASLATVFPPAPGSPLSPPDGVSFVAAGDFNNDGIPDLALITENDGANYVGIALGNGDGTFQAPVNYGAGLNPAMVAVADVNGDGNLDLIVPDESDNVVDVLLGNGDGTFQGAVTYATGNTPSFVAVADFNGDGVPDLAVTNSADGTVSILLGAGGGTFAAQIPYGVGANPIGVVAGDFNNDGYPDLAVSNNADGTVSILLDTGLGAFAKQTILGLPDGASPYGLAAGDLRRNGTLDLVVADSGSSNVYVLLGNNNGTFPARVAYPVASKPQAVALGDVNGDGILDIVSANYGLGGGFGNTVSVLIGTGTGTFGTQTPYGVGVGPFNVALADYNGDGLLDIADADSVDGTATILLQEHTETAIAAGVSAPLSGSQYVLASYPGDADRAPSESAILALTGGGSALVTSTTALTIAPNPAIFGQIVTMTATISPVPGSPFGTVTFSDGTTVLDVATVNASGVATFTISSLTAGAHGITAQYSGNTGLFGSISNSIARITAAATSTTTLALSAASVTAGTATTLTATVLNGVTPVTSGVVTFCNANVSPCEDAAILGTANLTADGTAALKLTFGVGVYSIDAVFAGSNAVQGSASSAQALTVTGIATYASTTTIGSTGSVGDYALTGTVAAFGSTLMNGNLSFLNTSNGNAVVATAPLNPATRAYGMIPAAKSPLAEANGPQNVVTGDFNGDGILDFAVADDNVPTVSIFLGNGDGTFQAAVTYPIGGYGVDLKAGDFNGDGKLDLVATNSYGADGPGNSVSVLLGNGDGTFRPQVAYSVGDYPESVAVGDFNGDGILDLAVGGDGSSAVDILLGNGDGTFQPQIEYPVGNQPLFLATGDFNGDGILDLAVLNSATISTVSVLLGNGDGTFQPQVVYPVGAGSSYNSDYIVAADINNDGRLDLVTANYNDNTVSVLLGVGDGTFQGQVTYPTGTGPNDIAVGDFNQDGNLDLAITNSNFGSGTTVGILYGNGNGTFQAQVAVTVGAGPWGIAAGDFNGDGLTDLVATNFSDNTVSVLLNQQTESATATGVTVFGTGTQSVLASYPGDAARSASLSATVPLTGTAPGATATTFTAAPNPAFAGQPVTLTATVTPAPTGTPLGTVSFYSGVTLLGTATVNSSGIATFTGELPVGAFSVTAVYSGNQGFLTSTSPPQIVNVSADQSSTITLNIAPASPVVAGTAVTLTATVMADTGVTTFPLTEGTVVFCNAAAAHCEGSAIFGNAQLTSAGTAAIKLTLGAGSYSIAATFQPIGGIPASASAAQPLTVTGAASYFSSTTLADSGIAGDYTLTGTVTAFGAVVPTGTVSFLDTTADNAVVGTAALNPASLGFTFLPTVGSPVSTGQVPQATVLGDFNHDGKLDMAVVNEGDQTVSVLLGNGDGTFQPQVTYAVGHQSEGIAMGDFNGDGNLDLVVSNYVDDNVSVLLGKGDGTFAPQVTYATAHRPQGIAVADFNGDGHLDLAVVNTFGFDVTILLGQGDGTFVSDSPATFAVGSYPVAIATADFNGDGNADLVVSNPEDGSVSVLLGNGDGTFQSQIVLTIPGEPDLTPIAVGDFNGDGIPDFVVGDAEYDDVYVFLGINGLTFQAPVSYTVGVAPFGIVAADFQGTGHLDLAVTNLGDSTVSLLLNQGDGTGTFQPQLTFPVASNPIGIAAGDLNGDGLPDLAVANASYAAPFTASILLAAQTETAVATGQAVYGTGIHNVLASYPGDADRAPSQSTTVALATIPQTVTVTTFTVAPNPAFVGQAITFTATVTPAPTGSPLGTVSFYIGSTLLGTATVNSSGVATLIRGLSAGVLSVTAVYSGNAGFAGSTSTAQTVTVNLNITATTLTAAPNPANAGQSVTLTATVIPPPILPTIRQGYAVPEKAGFGTVSFYYGETLLGSGNLNSSGVATSSTTTLPVGADGLTAVYSGDSIFAGSTSSLYTETITAPATSTTTVLTASPNPAIAGQSVTLTATVAPAPTGTPAGTVSFYNGETLLGTIAVNSSGVAAFITSSLPVGALSITAVYSGNTTFAGSTSTAVTEMVTAGTSVTATTTTLTASPSPLLDRQPVTLTATVSPAPSGTPNGTVVFYSGTTLLGTATLSSSGVATLTLSSLVVGTDSITAAYSGNSGFAASVSATLSLTVTTSYTISAPATPFDVAQGGFVTVNITVPPLGGAYNNTVTLSASGLPGGATATFNPPTVVPGTAGAPTVMTIQLASLSAGIPARPLPANRGGFPGAALSLAFVLFGAVLARKRVPRGLALVITLAGLGITTSLLTSCNGGFQNVPHTQAGTYVVTITGTSGALQSSATITLVVE